MVHKSKKINKRRYFKRRTHKVLYGGEPSNNELEQTNNIPSTTDNLKQAVSIGSNISNIIAANGLQYAESGIKNISEIAGIDPNASLQEEIKKIAQKTGEMSSALRSPEAQAALIHLGEVITEVSERVLSPALIKIIDDVAGHSDKIIANFINAVINAANSTPIAPLLGIPRTISNLASGTQTAIDLTNNILSETNNAVKGVNENKGKIESAYNDLMNIINKGNQFVSDGLNEMQENVNTYGQGLMKKEEEKQGAMKEGEKQVLKTQEMQVQKGGGLLKKLKEQSRMVGGRIIESQREFLSSSVSQKDKYYKRNNKTRRRVRKR